MTNKGITGIPLFEPILPKMDCPLFGVTTVVVKVALDCTTVKRLQTYSNKETKIRVSKTDCASMTYGSTDFLVHKGIRITPFQGRNY